MQQLRPSSFPSPSRRQPALTFRSGPAGSAGPPGPPVSPAHRRRIAYSQNFLRDARVADAALDRAALGPDDLVYEIGPGDGTLTDRLARRCRHVVAVEKDDRLAERLRRRFSARPNVTVFLADFLQFPLRVTPYKVFANVPFNVTAAIVSRLTDAAGAPGSPEDAYLAVQREAAWRYAGYEEVHGSRTTARGTHVAETLVSVLLKPWFEPSIVHQFARRDFVPQPGVDVVLLRLRKRGPPLVEGDGAQRFRDLAVHGFTAWQPSVRRAFEPVLGAAAGRVEASLRQRTGVTLDLPPSAFPFDAWLALYRCVEEVGGAQAWARLAGAEARLRAQQAGLQKVHRTRASRTKGL